LDKNEGDSVILCLFYLPVSFVVLVRGSFIS